MTYHLVEMIIIITMTRESLRPPSIASRPLRLLGCLLALTGLTLSACGGPTSPVGPRPNDPASAGASTGAAARSTAASALPSATAGTSATSGAAADDVRETNKPRPRIAVTYDGGVQVLDGRSLRPVQSFPLAGFVRLNQAGDGRRLMITEADGFRLLDVGSWTEKHGDHGHSFVAPPRLTEVSFPADRPGHVVAHAGTTVLFADGTGEITVLESAKLDNRAAPPIRTHRTSSAHHGVALVLPDGTMLHTEGNSQARSTVVAVNRAGQQIARSDECPGVHGEATAADHAVVFGCENGVLIYSAGRFTKVAATHPYARSGNLSGSEHSAVVLGDYKTDRDAELERPTTVVLADTKKAAVKLVRLPASYSLRSLARGPQGEALVLGTDGALRVIDPDTGRITASIPVTRPWIEPDDWQQPRPTVTVVGERVYVTEPAGKQIHLVGLESRRVLQSATVAHPPNELAGVTG